MDQVAHFLPQLSLTSPTGWIIISIIILSLVYTICPSWFIHRPITLVMPHQPAEVDKGLSIKDLVLEKVPSLRAGFKPSWWLPNGHAQTIYSAMANFSKDDPISYQSSFNYLMAGPCELLPDTRLFKLIVSGIDILPPLSQSLPASSPIVILNHGLTGGSHESYVRNMVLHLAKSTSEGGLGARVAVVNVCHDPNQGCAGTPITSPHLYSSGTTLDTHTATLYLSSLFPEARMFGVGFSLGAAVMTRYLGEQGEECRLQAACVLCAPLELRGMSAKLDARQLFPKLYSYSMARKMLHSLRPHLHDADAPLISPDSHLHPHVPALLSMAGRYRFTLRASHVLEAVAAKVGGSGEHFPFAGLKQFLEWACPGIWLERIRRPTLGISAIDDPIVAGDCLPLETVESSSHFVLAAVPYGGHLGWFDGPLTGSDKHRRWHVKPVLEFLSAATALPEKKPSPLQTTEKDGWTWIGQVGWKVVHA